MCCTLGVQLSELVDASRRVAATSARTAKIQILAELLRSAAPEEIAPVVSLLCGRPYQGRVGVGWASLGSIDVPPAAEPTLAVADLDVAVDEVAALTGPGSAAARTAALTRLLSRATEDETRLIQSAFLGEVRHGALEGVVGDAVARAAGVPLTLVRRAAMFTGELPEVARLALTDGAPALEAVALRPLTPIQPMLASTAADVAEAVAACGLSSVEWKLDGARIQAHRVGDEVRLFTRSLRDVTDGLPALVSLVLALPVRSVVLDGEVVGGDLLVRFFDCLHLDGEDLVDRPLLERLDALERAASPVRVPSITTDDPDEAERFLAQSIESGHEGVMVKTASSLYEAGRRGKAWRKVKPVHTLDLVVLAAEWGHGRRRGWLSNLHLGARSDDGGFVMVGKTFKGMTDEVLRWQTERLQELEERREGIAVFVRPELVVEVAVDSVQRSTRYAGGVALRFARIRRYRDDKSAAEADTIDAVRALVPGSG